MPCTMDARYARENPWARLLAYVTGLINHELLLKNEYLAAENRILRAHLPARLRLSDPERSTLADIGKRLGRKVLAEVACVAKPDTILGLVPKVHCEADRKDQPGEKTTRRPPGETQSATIFCSSGTRCRNRSGIRGSTRSIRSQSCPRIGIRRSAFPEGLSKEPLEATFAGGHPLCVVGFGNLHARVSEEP